jgi:FAD/FMN-containing dehydrogenase
VVKQRSEGAVLPATALAELRQHVGAVIAPGEDGYEAARRIWNGMIDRHPAAIVRCTGVADVMAAVRCAREHDLPLAVRGGGHGVAGRAVCDDGIVIDLSPMKGIWVDPAACTARAQAGVLWGEFDRETQAFGLATTGGVVSTTGIAGLTLAGGFGWLMRKHGLTIDNLRAVDLVTAEGELLRASADEHPDLFWAVRGAGANFGVVTSFEYQLHPVGPTVIGGMVLHPFEQAGAVLRFFREVTAGAPDELTTYAGLLTSPEGVKLAAIVVCYAGSLTAGEAAVRPIRAFGAPVADLIGPIPYSAQQTLFNEALPAGRQYYEKSCFLRELSDAAIETLVDGFARVPSPSSMVIIEQHGGAIRRVPEDGTAFPHRAPEYNLILSANWADPADTAVNVQWTRDLYTAIQPFATEGYYINYMAEVESAERARAAYGGNYARLAALKATYDPSNLFRFNHNIPPA